MWAYSIYSWRHQIRVQRVTTAIVPPVLWLNLVLWPACLQVSLNLIALRHGLRCWRRESSFWWDELDPAWLRRYACWTLADTHTHTHTHKHASLQCTMVHYFTFEQHFTCFLRVVRFGLFLALEATCETWRVTEIKVHFKGETQH